LKKQAKVKKLELHKETLTALESVAGGSQVWNTVYYPPAPRSPFDGPVVWA
jgi:hypothetical protein